MKIIFILLFGFLISTPIAFGAPIADKTGLKFSFPVNSANDYFVIEGTANFDVKQLDFNDNSNEMTLKIQSSIEENLMEIVIPTSLIGDNPSVTVDQVEIFPRMHSGIDTTFITLEFIGIGEHHIVISEIQEYNLFQLKNELDYEIKNGQVESILANTKYNSLLISVSESADNSDFVINLSDSIITPFDDGEFLVLVNGKETDYTLENETFSVLLNSQTETIQIIGTHVVPEFTEIAPIVLATSLIGIVALRRCKKLNY